MIDWKVMTQEMTQIGEILAFPPGYDQQRDGCCFPDWSYQGALLVHFQTGSVMVEYDGGLFKGADLGYLQKSLSWTLDRYEGAPDSINHLDLSSFESVPLKRDVIVQILSKTLEMNQQAKELNACLVFSGD
ncbi:MAG: hypothetical protein SFU83_17940 [Meiothermus sp.]|nr:hypothetical protein [Meiothermus sp.]